jgi:hypothetical protein
LHPFTQKELERLDNRLGRTARMAAIAARLFNPIDQAGHQATCGRSHRALSRGNAQKNWAHSAFPAAALGPKIRYLPSTGILKTVP